MSIKPDDTKEEVLAKMVEQITPKTTEESQKRQQSVDQWCLSFAVAQDTRRPKSCIC